MSVPARDRSVIRRMMSLLEERCGPDRRHPPAPDSMSGRTIRPARYLVNGLTAAHCTSLRLELHVLVRRRPGIVRDEPESRLRHASAVSLQHGELPDREVHDLVVHQLLDALEERLALLRIQLARLIAEER